MSIFLNSFSDQTVADLEVQGVGFSCIRLGKKTCCLVLSININSDLKSPEFFFTGPFKEEKIHLRTFIYLLGKKILKTGVCSQSSGMNMLMLPHLSSALIVTKSEYGIHLV